jgi:rod shape-determining protein MreD
MRWGTILSILLALFVIESTLLQVVVPDTWGSFVLVPRFTLVFLIFLSLYIGRRRAFFLGLIFGLFYDILFGGVIGIYAFSMAFVPYFCALAYRYFQLNMLLILLTVFLGVYTHETVVYLLYHLFGLTANDYSLYQYLPTAMLNSVFAAVVFKPVNRMLSTIDDRHIDDRSA